MSKRLPPFGRDYMKSPCGGLQVAIGIGAWTFARHRPHPTLVMPEDADPKDYLWPSDGLEALVYELGPPKDDRLEMLAGALLTAGASSVVAIRTSLAPFGDPRIYFDRDTSNAEF